MIPAVFSFFVFEGMEIRMKRLTAVGILLIFLSGFFFAGEAETLTRNQLSSFYKGSFFIGDSITEQLKGYIRSQQQEQPDFFPDITFMTAQSYCLYTASRKNLLPEKANLKSRGKEMPLWEILKDRKPKKALILLGVNDYIGETIEKGMDYDNRILDLAQKHAPDTEVIFLSLTPVTKAFCKRNDYQRLWDDYNAALRGLCLLRGVPYIDIAARMKDEEGYLNNRYSNDGQYHLNAEGLDIWIDALLDYAQGQYDQGLWKPEEAI